MPRKCSPMSLPSWPFSPVFLWSYHEYGLSLTRCSVGGKLTNVTFSTPIGTLHWFLAKFHASWRASICITHGAYLIHYAVARVYLLYYILKIYGAWTGQTAVESFAHLHRPCQIGTGVIGISNTVWLVLGLRKFIRKYF